MDKFLEEVVGHGYDFDYSSLVLPRRNSSVELIDMNLSFSSANAIEDHEIDPERNFFCSELIIKALKYCGILVMTEDSSKNFLPCDLSSKNPKVSSSLRIKNGNFEEDKCVLLEPLEEEDDDGSDEQFADLEQIDE